MRVAPSPSHPRRKSEVNLLIVLKNRQLYSLASVCEDRRVCRTAGHKAGAAMEEGGNMYEEPRGGGGPPEGREIDDAMNGPARNGADVQLEDFVGVHAEYNEEEEERKYFSSQAGMLTYRILIAKCCWASALHHLQHFSILQYLSVGIYALFVSTNYWERYFTLVPSAVAIGAAIVPLWASMGNYILRMAQKYYEYVNYKLEHVQEQKRAPRGAYNSYIIIFEAVFYGFFFLSFVYAQFPMFFFLNNYLFELNHTLFDVKNCGTASHGILTGFNTTVLQKLPRSSELIIVLFLCGSAYRPTEEIDLRNIGWGNIFQLPFKHMRDYRLRCLLLFFIYSGFEVLFLCTGFTLNYGVCSIGLEHMAYILTSYGISSAVGSTLALTMLRLPRQVPLLTGASIHAIILIALFCWEPQAKNLAEAPIIYLVAAFWGLGSALNKTGLSTLLGMLYEDKERQDFIFTIYHWWQACAIFVIPKPRHKVRGYRYLEEDNSDATDSEEEEEEGEQSEGEEEANEPDVPPHCPRRRRQHDYGEPFGEDIGDIR
ncbi:hypothetical protein E2320_020572, partial [Naja naja]